MKLHEVSLKFHGKFQIVKLPSPAPTLSLERKKKSKTITLMNFEVNSLFWPRVLTIRCAGLVLQSVRVSHSGGHGPTSRLCE